MLLNAPHVLRGLLQNVRPARMVTTYKEQLALVIKHSTIITDEDNVNSLSF